MTMTIAKGTYDPPWCAPPKTLRHTGKPIDESRRCGARGAESRSGADAIAASSVGNRANEDAASVATSKTETQGPKFYGRGQKRFQGSQCVLQHEQSQLRV